MINKITVCILTHNEAGKLEKLLPTLKFASEIIIVDDNSSDETVLVAQKFKAKIFVRALNGDFGKQRNFALKQAKAGWVLFIDPDEVMGDKLIKEIKQVTELPEYDGYYIERRDIYRGKLLLHGETGRCKLIRLGKKGSGWWSRKVHEVWEIKKVGKLKQTLLHNAHDDYKQFKDTVDRYAKIEAKYRFEIQQQWSLLETLAFPLIKFILNYFLYFGFLDGKAGLQYAALMSRHSYKVRVNLYKLYHPYARDEQWLTRGWRYLFYSFLVFVGGYQLTRIQLTPTLGVYVFEGLMLALELWGLLIIFSKKSWIWPVYSVGLMIVSVGFGISLVANYFELSSKELIMASLYWWRLLFYFGFMLILNNLFRLKVVLISPIRLLIYLGSLIAVSGLIQYFIWPDLRWLYEYGWDDHLYRLAGTILDPGFAGLILALTLILVGWKKIPYRKPLWIVIFTALLFTYARSAYMVFLAGEWTLGLMTRNFKTSLLRTVLLITTVLLLPRPAGEGVRLERTYSIEARAKSVVTAWDIFVKKPVFGIGFNAYRLYTQPLKQLVRAVHPSAPDNSFLFVLVTAGVVGMLSFLFLMGFLLIAAKNQPVIIASLVAIGLSGMTNNSLFYPLVMIWIALLFAKTSYGE